MKKILSVLFAALICITMFASVSVAATVNGGNAASSVNNSQNASASMIGAILKAMLGDAASGLTDQDIGKIAQSIIGDVKLSDLPTLVLGENGKKLIEEINDYLNSLQTETTTIESATRPPETTEPATEAPETTTVPPTEPATTAQPVTQYIYVYPTQPAGSVSASEYTLPTGEFTTGSIEITTGDYIVPEIIITNPDYNYYNGVIADNDDSDSDDGFGLKAVIGLLIMLGGGAAVVILLLRRKNNSIYY